MCWHLNAQMLSWVLYLYYYMFLSLSAHPLVCSVPGTESNSAGGAEHFVVGAEKKTRALQA